MDGHVLILCWNIHG